MDALCYPLMVASTRVKPANASNITSSYINSGTASYDPDENVLTLDNLEIETDSRNGGIQAEIANMTVQLVGDNTITLTGTNNNAIGISFNESSGVTVTGGGSLTMSGGNSGNIMFLNTHQPVDSVMFTIKDCTVNATPYSDDYEENLTVDNATLRGTGLSIGHTLVLKDCYVAKPAGASFEYGMFCIDGEYYYGDFEILPGSGLLKGDVNGDGIVNGSDVTALYNYLEGLPYGGDGDVNGDGVVSGADVTALYNILLNS
ncbi:MAG: hypothetical protein J6X70_06115 [Muribaculaceae bacterium]|nr:hypothetical protein [Muribaculaceae bacterium]